MPEEKAEMLHNVFISWSGERSKFIALALRKLLPMVLQASKPFMSEKRHRRGQTGPTRTCAGTGSHQSRNCLPHTGKLGSELAAV